jgi:hypothetical protein
MSVVIVVSVVVKTRTSNSLNLRQRTLCLKLRIMQGIRALATVAWETLVRPIEVVHSGGNRHVVGCHGQTSLVDSLVPFFVG